MRIIVDDAIPLARECFSPFGEVVLLPGKSISPTDVADAEILIVRSRTRVDRKLLENSRIRFVASTVVGLDHIDQDYLAQQDIGFYSAQGCNANSVTEYVIAALLELCQRQQRELSELSIGIIGVGNVGSRLAAKCRGLGMRVACNDPPRQSRESLDDFVDLETALEQDIITLHVPLHDQAPWQTAELVNSQHLARMRPQQILINAARGEVLAEDAACDSPCSHLIMDCWQHEPDISTCLLAKADIATPHIAGHSLDAKLNGTWMAYQALCQFLGQPATLVQTELYPAVSNACIELDNRNTSGTALLRQLIHQLYDIWADDQVLRQDDAREQFEYYRRHYPVRREWHNYEIRLSKADTQTRNQLQALGFKVTAHD